MFKPDKTENKWLRILQKWIKIRIPTCCLRKLIRCILIMIKYMAVDLQSIYYKNLILIFYPLMNALSQAFSNEYQLVALQYIMGI